MQSFFVFCGGGIIVKFKSKLSLCWSRWFHWFRPIFLKWGWCLKLSIFDPSRHCFFFFVFYLIILLKIKTSKINCHEMSNLSDPCCFPEWRCWGKKFLTQVVDCPRELLDERNHKLGPSASKHRGPLQLAGRLLRGVLRYSKNQTFPEFSAWKLDHWHLSTLLELPPDTWRRSVRQAGQVTRIES